MSETGFSFLATCGTVIRDTLQALCLSSVIARSSNLNGGSESKEYMRSFSSLFPGSSGGLAKKTHMTVSPTDFSTSPLHAMSQLLISSMCILPPNVRLEMSLASRFKLLFLVTTVMNISGALTVPSDQILTA